MRERIDWSKAPFGEMSDNEIARRMNCSVNAVTKARIRRGIPPKPQETRFDGRTLRRWRTMRADGMTYAAIAADHGCSVYSVWTRVNDL